MKRIFNFRLFYVALLLLSVGCANTKVARDVKLVAFDDNVEGASSIGSIEGKDCTWRLFGYSLGSDPTAYRAFLNTMNGEDGGAIPLMSSGAKQSPLKVVRNVTIANDGFSAWIVGRSCVVVTGAGYR